MNIKSLLRSFSIIAIIIACEFTLTAEQDCYYSLGDAKGVPLDKKLAAFLSHEGGVFIEVGAHDGITQSNTKHLEEKYGWTGILVEPSENLYSELCSNRPASHCFNCALGTFEQNNTIIWGDFDGRLMSSVHGERLHRDVQKNVVVRSLQSILDELGISHINFFSLDTEGYELNILRGIDFSRTTFDYLLIEIYDCSYDEIAGFLASKGYEMAENFSGYNFNDLPYWEGTYNDYLFKRI